MEVNLVELMNISESLIDLETRISQKRERKFSNGKEYIDWLQTEWHKISKYNIDKLLTEEPKECEFPTIKLNNEGIEYQLHGIIHGMDATLYPGWHARENVKEYLSKEINKCHDPKIKSSFLCEENFSTLFNFPESQELKDISYTNNYSEPTAAELCMSLLIWPFARTILPILYGGLGLYSKTIKNPKTEQAYIYLSQKALVNEKYQGHFAKLRELDMPQPFNLETEYIHNKEPNKLLQLIHLLTNTVEEKIEATCAERSKYTANELIRYAKQRKLKTLHYIGGMKHISEIAYFLKNPNYSFKKIEQYRITTRDFKKNI
jgi:hypothetical protein